MALDQVIAPEAPADSPSVGRPATTGIGAYFSPRQGLRTFMEEGEYAEVLETLARELEGRNYSPQTILGYLRGARHVTWSLEHRRLSKKDLTEQGLATFAESGHERCGCPFPERSTMSTRSAMKQLLPVLQRMALAPRPKPRPFQSQLEAFGRFMADEKGLAVDTVELRQRTLAGALAALMPRGIFDTKRLTSERINAHILEVLESGHRGQAKKIADTMRGFCRFLMADEISLPLDPKSIRGPKYRWVPANRKVLTVEELRRLLRPLLERTAVASRDLAVLLLIGRTGLRRSDVSRAGLNDFHARAGTLTVRKGKSRRAHEVPVPNDARDAILNYVRNYRASAQCPALFLAEEYPYDVPLSPSGVTAIVRRAFERAGIDHPSKGAHVLRHTLATHLVATGSPLKAVADILVHESIKTTAQYAHVDRRRLKAAIRPWPKRRGVKGARHGQIRPASRAG